MFFDALNKSAILKGLLSAMLLAALNPGCSIQGFIAKKVLTSVGKKVYHKFKDHDENHKDAKSKAIKSNHVSDKEPE